MRETAHLHRAGIALLLVGLAWMISREMHFSAWVDDDAFISFRYARNWAHGNGLVFNPGEYVEGYTNFLWTALLTVASRFGLDLPATAQILGSVLSILTVLTLLGTRNTGLLQHQDPTQDAPSTPTVVVFLAPLALSLMDSWAAWAVGGLENVFSGFLVATSFLVYFRFVSNPQRPDRLLLLCSVLLCLAIMNHPTNAIFAALIALHVLLGTWKRHYSVKTSMTFFAVLAVVLATFVTARFAYYGDLLPNTFYAKGGMSAAVWQRGLLYFTHILRSHPLPYAMTLTFAVLLLTRRVRNTALSLLVLAVVVYSLYIIAVGGEEFPAYRSTVVLLPLFALQLAAAFQALQRRVGRQRLAAAALAAALLALFAGPLYWNERVRRLDTAVADGRTALSRTAAMLLKQQLPANTLFAHSGAGLIAFYTDFPWIDTLGLCDHHIARSKVETLGKGAAGHEKGDGQYVWDRQPDFVMFPGYPISNRLPGTKSDKELWAISEFHQRYRPVRVGFTFQSSLDSEPKEHSLFLYQRIDP